ncbi:hypothetical protein GBA52_028553 [Prunus armeniaca]|nr:hypothetical protein GBA52_028553 [Prunus armeniaca]
MEILLKKLYVRRMAADLGITKIYASGKMVFMKTSMNKKVFKLITDSMVSDVHEILWFLGVIRSRCAKFWKETFIAFYTRFPNGSSCFFFSSPSLSPLAGRTSPRATERTTPKLDLSMFG